MVIYGVALLAICMLSGLVLGHEIGHLLGIDANVGGVGIAMILLVVASDLLRRSGRLSKPTQGGVLFWSSIYIPVVVAMAAKQNVLAAFQGGGVAVLAGVLTVIVCFALTALLSRIGQPELQPLDDRVSSEDEA